MSAMETLFEVDEVSGWVKLATNFYSHPKAIMAGPTARHLYYVSLMWAGEHATDGVIPAMILPHLAMYAGISPDEVDEVADKLVEVRAPGSTEGLWERIPEGWVIHDWLAWQTPSKQRTTTKPTAAKSAANRRDGGVGGEELDADVDTEVDTPPYSPPPAVAAANAAIRADFEVWYSVYPRRREKEVGFAAYLNARKGGGSAADLLTAAENYARQCRLQQVEMSMVKYPATFLNKGRWADYLPDGPGLTEAAGRCELPKRDSEGRVIRLG